MRLFLFILSWGWVILGLWWFFRPAGIKRRFEKKYHKTARWLLLGVLIVTGGVLFSVGRQLGGIWGTLLFVIGIIAIIKALLFVRGKASDVVLEWWGAQPVSVYRAAAAGLFVLGLLMVWILKFGS